MIYDKLSKISSYRGIHPNLDLALDYIQTHLSDMPEHIDIQGTEVYGNIFTYETVKQEDSFFEAHANFADIHIMRSGAEKVDLAHISTLEVDEAKPENDFWALHGVEDCSLVLNPTNFLIVLPGDAHKLKIQLSQPETVTKSVFKVKM